MLWTARFSYEFGGVVMPIYRGEVEVSVNLDRGADRDEVMSTLKSRARKLVQQRSAWNGAVELEPLTPPYSDSYV